MRIALLGDIALFGGNTVKNPNWKQKFAGIISVLEQCDYVVGNLETPLTIANKPVGGKSAYIKGAPEDVAILKCLGITHVTLANNHIFDYRENGFQETVKVLEDAGIQWYGANGKYVDVDDQKSRVRLLGYCCYSTNAVGLETEGNYVNLLHPDYMKRDIKEAEGAGALPILSCHWGQEHVHYPDYDHINLSRSLSKDHEIVVHGHHPHVIQGLETNGKSLIAYSLGNFCFADVYTSKSKEPLVKLSQDNRESFILILTVEGSSVAGYEIVPFRFSEQDYSVEESIQGKIEEWSSFLKVPKDQYNKKRINDIRQYISERKKKRDLQWFIKRLNYNSLKMIQRSKHNDERYREIMDLSNMDEDS